MNLTNTGVGMTGIAGVTVAPGTATATNAFTIRQRRGADHGSAGEHPAGNRRRRRPGIPWTVRPIPALSQTAPTVGQSMAGRLRARAGDVFAVFLGSPILPVFVPVLEGALSMDPSTAILMAIGAVDAAGLANWLLTIPPDPANIGLTLATQGVAGSTSLRLSSAMIATVR